MFSVSLCIYSVYIFKDKCKHIYIIVHRANSVSEHVKSDENSDPEGVFSVYAGQTDVGICKKIAVSV